MWYVGVNVPKHQFAESGAPCQLSSIIALYPMVMRYDLSMNHRLTVG